MNRRELLLDVLRARRAHTVPWYGDLSWWCQAQTQRSADFKARYDGEEGYLQLHKDAGVGICFYAPQVWTADHGEDVTSTSRTEGTRTWTCLTTPVGSVESVQEFLPESHTSAYREHFVKHPGDLAVMRYVFSHRRITPNDQAYRRVDALWGEQGLAVGIAPCCTAPLQTLLTRWAGVEKTIELLVDAPDELDDTIACLEEADDEIFAAMADSSAEVVEFPDNLDGTITGKALIERYEVPYWKRRIDLLHRKGKIVGIHNDGGVRAALPLLIEAGFDFAEAVTPAPFGDIEVDEIRRVAEGRIVIWGGLPGAMFSTAYPDACFVGHLQRVLDAWRGMPFVLGVADQVPPDASFERIRSVARLVHGE